MNAPSSARSHRWMTSVCIVIAVCIVTIAATLFIVSRMFAARPGEWAMPIRWGVFGVGVKMDASVASMLRVATHPLGIALLDGRSIATPHGSFRGLLRFTRMESDGLAIDCAPCRIELPGLGGDAFEVDAARITVYQRVDRLWGTIVAGSVTGHYRGSFDARGIKLDISFDTAPISAYYRLFGDRIPEARVADIRGSASFEAKLEWPSARLVVSPSLEGFAVSGLGTEELAGRLPAIACGAQAVRDAPSRARTRRDRTNFGPWLPRAVVAAEDQRYFEHPGYDLDELAASLARNQASSRIERGASTIPQQLARLLYVGSERSTSRKLREILYAVEMEQTLGKARMLHLYLAVAPWGEGVCGAEAAALRYFGTSAGKLSGAQAVWLAAMLHAPDREAAHWAESGHIDPTRGAWVAGGLFGIRRDARARILDELAAMAATHDEMNRP